MPIPTPEELGLPLDNGKWSTRFTFHSNDCICMRCERSKRFVTVAANNFHALLRLAEDAADGSFVNLAEVRALADKIHVELE